MARPSGAVILSSIILGCSSGTEPIGLRSLELRLIPEVSALLINDTTRAAVVGFDGAGAPYPAGPVLWRSTNPAVVEIDDEGLARARTPGSATIIATVGQLSDSTDITVAGTLHANSIGTSETWTVPGAPHVVRGRLTVGANQGATLTIEAGAGVVFEDGAGLTFGVVGTGSLVATGSVAAPITMRGTSATAVPGAWIGLTFRGRTQSQLRHVTMSGCGGPRTDDQPTACVVLGHAFLGSDPTLLVDNVTVHDASTAALVLQGESRFAPGSAGLSVRNVRGHVATMPAAAAAGFPLGGSFSSNEVNEVRLLGDTIKETSSWTSPGPSWHLLGRVLIEGPQTPVLTVPAGSNLTFDFGAGFGVGENAPGGLRIGAAGAATVNLTTFDPNGWGGIVFFPGAAPSSITRAVLENCGSFNESGYGLGCILVIGNFFGTAPAPVLQDVTILRAVDVGVALVGGGAFGVGSSNVVISQTRGSPGSPISSYRGVLPSIPPGQYTGNLSDAIWVSEVEIAQSETWRARGVPYVMQLGLTIGHATNPLLTLEAGVELRFSPGGSISVGAVAPGGLRAVGGVNAPVVFTGEFAFPGAWMGVDIGPFASTSTLLDRVTVDYAGADDGTFATAIRIARDLGPIVRNSLIRRSGGCGITRMSGSPWTTNFTAMSLGNTFQDNAGPNQCGP